VVVRSKSLKRKPGSFDLNIRWRRPGGEYRLRALYRLVARNYDKTKPHEFADSGRLLPQSIPGAARRTGVRVAKDAGSKFTLLITEGVAYSTGYELKLDKLEKPKDGVIHAWLTARDTFKDGVRTCDAGWRTVEAELGKVTPGDYLLLVHRRKNKKDDYGLSQRALLSSSDPLSPYGINPEQMPRRWQAPGPDAPDASDAKLLRSRLALARLHRPAKRDGNWKLGLRADLPAGMTLKTRGVRLDAVTGHIEINLWTGKPEVAGEETDTVLVTLPHLVPRGYQCEVWLNSKDSHEQLVWCRMLNATNHFSGVRAGTGVRGAMPDPYCTLSLTGRLDGDDGSTMKLKQARGGFKLEAELKLSIYEKSVRVDRVEGPDDDGVIRVYLEFKEEKHFDGKKPHLERVSARLGKLHEGRYRIEFYRDTWRDKNVQLPEHTCWIEATAD
jgi:hypothetical protein